MAGFTNNGKNLMLGGLPSPIYASLHTADPGTTGTSEVTGGAPAYARKSCTLNAASAGSRTSSTQPTFDVPAATTITFVGWWDAVTAGNFLGSAAITSEAFGAQGTYQLTAQTFSIT